MAQPTGILSFQVHQLADIEARTDHNRKKDGEDIPSSYVNVFLNDEKVFHTRMKPVSAIVSFGSSEFL